MIEDTESASSSFRQTVRGGKRSRFAWVFRDTILPFLRPAILYAFSLPRRKRQNKKAPAGAGAFYRSYMPNGQTIGMTTRQTMREITHIGTPTFA